MFIKLWIQCLILLLVIDSPWIIKVASPWMKRVVPHLLAQVPNLLAAGLFYLLYTASLVFLVIAPGISQKVGLNAIALQSFVLGIMAYATYDLTNLAVMKGFTWSLALADMLWGGVLTMTVTLIVFKLNTA